jgi:adenylyl cyclase-associated protein
MNEPLPPVIVARMELTPIIRRLEAATSRLEDMASAVVEAPKTNGASPAVTATAPVSAMASQPAAPKKAAEPLPQIIEDFDTFINTALKKYVDLSNEVGGPVAEQVRSYDSVLLKPNVLNRRRKFYVHLPDNGNF